MCDLILCYTKVRSPSILKFDVYFTVLKCGSSSNYKTLMSYSIDKHICGRLPFTKHWGHLPFTKHIEVVFRLLKYGSHLQMWVTWSPFTDNQLLPNSIHFEICYQCMLYTLLIKVLSLSSIIFWHTPSSLQIAPLSWMT